MCNCYQKKFYRIELNDYKIQVVCDRCYNNGQVNPRCNECGGKGVHSKTKQKWEISNSLELLDKIDRDENGELRYWIDSSSYFREEDKLIHFSFNDALGECNRRNALLSKIK